MNPDGLIQSIYTRAFLVQNYWRRARSQHIYRTIGDIQRTWPTSFRRLLVGDNRQLSNTYTESNLDEDLEFCSVMLNENLRSVMNVFNELDDDIPFLQYLSNKYYHYRQRRLAIGRFRCWWAIVRLKRPEIICETGVHDGLSSAIILRAMERNGKGLLLSVDLPSIDLPRGVSGPGWLVPPRLRRHWRLEVGNSQDMLPDLMGKYGDIDIFIHDSNHEEAHQEFEYRTVYPYMSSGSLILCDDPVESLLYRLARDWESEAVVIRRLSTSGESYLGGIKVRRSLAFPKV